jgi:hypothetical protein
MHPRLLFVACLAYCLFAATQGWHRSLVEDQSFRQSQTAISTYYMIGQAPKLAYETPVVGPPWSIPFEFPLYQWLVALLVSLGHTPLDPTGRFVSLAFFLISLIPAHRLLGDMRLSRDNRLLILSLLLINPYYIYWSRSFLIESTAFCFGMWYLAFGVAFLKSPRPWTAGVAVVTGTLGALVKITTFAVFFWGVGLVWLYLWWSAYRIRQPWSRLVGRGLVIVLPPLAGLWWWTHFADAQKELNYIGRAMTSHAVTAFCFGTWQQRLAGSTWQQLYRWYNPALGHIACVAVCVPALCWGGRRREILTCLLLGLGAPLVFINLHYHHEYYPYANLAFFLAAMALALVAFRERGGVYRFAANGLLALAIGLSLYRYYDSFYPRQTWRATGQWLAKICHEVQRVSHPDDVVLVIGWDWDSSVAYYSQRRALMIPHSLMKDFVANLPAYRRNLAGYRIAALVIFDQPGVRISPSSLQFILQEFNFAPDCIPIYGDCSVYKARDEELASQL